jgi:8-oxo-dGTP pyrophosphatase MutT (NUDIX family)
MTERRICVRGIILKQNKILAQQLTADHHGVERNFWCTPGGGLDENESLHQGLNREMIEETGITPVIGKLLFIQQFNDGEREQLEFFFNIENVDDYNNISLEQTTHGIAEIKRVDFIDAATNDILPSFLRTINIQDYVENTNPVFVINNL